jgi:hypothetical protein
MVENKEINDTNSDSNTKELNIVEKNRVNIPKEDPLLEGIADSMVTAFFIVAAIKICHHFYSLYC